MIERSRHEVLLDDLSPRSRIVPALTQAADQVAARFQEHSSDGEVTYLVGTGYDFAQFSVPVAEKLGGKVAGVACLWTEGCEIAGMTGDRVFALRQEFVEPAPSKAGATLLVCASVIADKMELLTHMIRVAREVEPGRLVIAGALVNSDVKHALGSFLRQYFDVDFFCDHETDDDLRFARDTLATKLDSRVVKVVPILSEWLLARRFGPRPKPGLDLSF